jgi:hypothetical protein
MCDLGGGSSATTDRKEGLKDFGRLGDVYSTLRGYGKTDRGLAATDRTAGAGDTGEASKFYSSILSGNPAAVMSAAGPAIKSITGSADQQKKQLTTLGDRTGGKAEVAGKIATDTRGQIADTIMGARSGAAAGKERIGAGETAAGLRERELAASEQGKAGDVAGTALSASISSRELSQKIHDQAVQDWGTAIAQILLA